jgi:hypothetical protein
MRLTQIGHLIWHGYADASLAFLGAKAQHMTSLQPPAKLVTHIGRKIGRTSFFQSVQHKQRSVVEYKRSAQI